ncbi:benzoate/H(+) symporter BenE family transporter [Rhodobacter sp. KR11]|uniref:benzoate/H(+) symporter BenE family transporter n=1 Tax=Rhodobacter sp. KR11 TaxID=2974588 RepID=UPI002221F0E5|nr:benzoate/H(+) symporter BenE family transporter [Rhodobacter sp. KR11]MCW1920500.1 benzoate/H(+) symporter BenE family transporter [Rhodobacter sp. KR11]
MRLSMISAALVAALVGFGSTIALVLAAAAALQATPAQTASWVTAICLMKAAGSAFLSARGRIPTVLAWSTPGAALIAATQGLTMAEGVGAFLLAGALIAASGAIRPLGALIARIPDSVASAMLAGVLLPFCLRGLAASPSLGPIAAAMIAVFALVRLRNPALAVLAALSTGLIAAFWGAPPALALAWPQLTFIAPQLSTQALIGLGLPLYLVTMASQNLPGFATQRAAGYTPQVAPALITTGALSVLGALAGAHTVNMAAITAALCMGDDVHPDRDQRWKVGLAYAGAWVALAALSPEVIGLLRDLPPGILTLLVGLALLGPLTGALTGAFAAPPQRFAATITLTVTASGLALYGVGAAFWGLLAGLAVLALDRISPKPR